MNHQTMTCSANKPVTSADVVVKATNISKCYGKFKALDDVSFEVLAGQVIALLGHNGAGKSTLLSLLAGLDTPTAGEVYLAGQALHALSEDQRAAIRAKDVGFVFQSFLLLPGLTALENVTLVVV